MKDGPIGWDDAPCTIQEVWECIGDDTCTAILVKNKDKLLVVVQKDPPGDFGPGENQEENSLGRLCQVRGLGHQTALPGL